MDRHCEYPIRFAYEGRYGFRVIEYRECGRDACWRGCLSPPGRPSFATDKDGTIAQCDNHGEPSFPPDDPTAVELDCWGRPFDD